MSENVYEHPVKRWLRNCDFRDEKLRVSLRNRNPHGIKTAFLRTRNHRVRARTLIVPGLYSYHKNLSM